MCIRDRENNYPRTTEATFKSSQAGVYYLRLEVSWGDTLQWSVALDDRPEEPPAPPPPTLSELSNPVASAHAVLGEGASDVFAFHAIAGRTYKFRTVLG